MPRPRVAMRKIRDVLRLTFGEGLSRRQVSASLGIPFTTVSDHVARAKAARLVVAAARRPRRRRPRARPVPADGAVARVPGRCRTGATSTPSCARNRVTLQLLWLEYREAHPDGYGYSQFCHHYQSWRKHVDVVMRQTHRAGREALRRLPRPDDPHLRPNDRGGVHESGAVRGRARGVELPLRRGAFPPRSSCTG